MAGRRRRRRQGPATINLPARADTPVRLLRDIAAKRVDASTLTKGQRQACVAVLANGKQTSAELGAIFDVSPSLIRRDLMEIRGRLGREVREWGIDEVVGDLVGASERFVAAAMDEGDVGLAWSIKRDTIRQLVELGIGKDQDRSGMKITIETIGEGYERARQQIGAALDPVLTGLVVEVEADPPGIDSTPRTPPPDSALAIPRRLPGPVPTAEPTSVVFSVTERSEAPRAT